MKRKITLTGLLIFCLPVFVLAQKGSVSGYVTDSLSIPVSYATVAVFDLRDSSVINFGLTDDGGGYELKGLPSGIPLRLLVSHVLYQARVKNFRLDSAEAKKLDTLKVSAKDNQLTEMVVTWEAPPIVVRNDTIEFNADAFIGRPGSAVEELLKRIPGVEVGEDGQITYNGRKVSRITIDSKQFFGDDPVILMKNIPAKAVQKVQITEEKDERGRATETGDVSINLTLKHWAKKSHFGKAYAGYGSDKRYESGFMWNFLRDTLQLSLIGFGNNLSQSGFSFSELYRMGGFNRSGVNYISFSDNNLEVDGTSFGGGKGITESGGGGFNFNYDIPRKWSVSSSYFFGLTRTRYNEDLESERYFGDTTLSISTLTRELAKGSTHSLNAKFRWTPDTLNMIHWRPKLTINGGKQNNDRQNENAYSYQSGQTYIANTLNSNVTGMNASNNLHWDIALKRWGYAMNSEVGLNDQSGQGENYIQTQTITDTATYEQNQFQERESESRGFFLNHAATVRFKVNDSLSFRFVPSVNHNESVRRVMVYERDSASMESVFLPVLSTRFNEQRTNYVGNLSMSKRVGKGRFSAHVSLQKTDLALENELGNSGIDRSFRFMETSFSFSKSVSSSYIDVDYNYTNELPGSSQLLDLVDNSDPNRIQSGNPELKPEKDHTLSTWGRMGNATGTRSIQWNGRLSVTQQGIVMENFFDEAGRSVRRPRNLASDQLITHAGFYVRFYASKESSKKWKHAPSFYISGSANKSWQYLNFSSYPLMNYYLRPAISYNILKKDYLDVRISYNPVFSSSQTIGLSQVMFNRYASIYAEIWWAPAEKYWLDVKGTYTRQASSNPAIEAREYTLVNAAFTRLILKENRGQIRLSIFDLLNQNRDIDQFASGNYVSTSISNAVTRYVMLSFVYNYNSFQKTGRQQRGFSFW